MSTESIAHEYHSVTPEQVEQLLQEMPPDETSGEMAETFKTLSDPARVRILYLLFQAELCVHDLAAILGMSQSAVSHHLKILRLMRLVKTRKEGRAVFYALDDDHVMRLFKQCLDHVEHRER